MTVEKAIIRKSEFKRLCEEDREINALERAFSDNELRHTLPSNPESVLQTRAIQAARVKRLMERVAADPRFREEVGRGEVNPAQFGLDCDLEELRSLWEEPTGVPEATKVGVSLRGASLPLVRYLAFCQLKKNLLERLRAIATPRDPRLRASRERQMARCASSMGVLHANNLLHAPACFELSKGCSVGCWFCGVSAPALDGHLLYTDANARLWRETLEVVHEFLGSSLTEAFCYWATDPFDNPDYERFLEDLYRISGGCPQTTTAVPQRDFGRTRELLRTSTRMGCFINRLSILSVGQLKKVHEAFTPEELTFVELPIQTKGSTIGKAAAGRARDHLLRKSPESLDQPGAFQYRGHMFTGQSIACVTGWLFNMVERSVKLISPCPADDQWPDGYFVFEEATFNGGSDLRDILDGMLDRHMSLDLREEDPIVLRQDLEYQQLTNGFRLSTEHEDVIFENLRFGSLFERLGSLVRTGDHTASQIAGLCASEFKVAPETTMTLLSMLRDKAVLSEPLRNGEGPSVPEAAVVTASREAHAG